MASISVCMIVKNEASILERCLESLKGLYEELIIVDTGSDDNTIDIAHKYTDKVFTYEWDGNFSNARNFCISHATCDYIYSADADEIIEGDNKNKFAQLKQFIDPRIDVVQMYYGNQLDKGTVYNFDKELRPKLFKRVKNIEFIEPIHETLNLEPIIFDSDIVITHKPTSVHTSRDLAAFKKIISSGETLSKRLMHFLFRELYLSSDVEEFKDFENYLKFIVADVDNDTETILEACTLLSRFYRMSGETIKMFDYALKVVAMESNSEVCFELGLHYYDYGMYDDAVVWFYNAYHECTPILSVNAGTSEPIKGLIDCYNALGMSDMVRHYEELSEEYKDNNPYKN